jgi:glyoxylase-like metal-dependent hydrolase (beta-lactamase superfamily II)
MTILRYGNTNTFFIEGNDGGLLVDTDYAGTLPAFYKALKQNGIKVNNIKYVLATHYHPDHMGLISDLMKQGAMLILIDVQRDYVHFSDSIFARDRLPYTPIDESLGTVISCSESRAFLLRAGITGEIIHTHSHSEDSVSLIMDDGDCFVGDLEPVEYLEAYDNNPALQKDWDELMKHGPKHIYYAHVNEKKLDNDGC